MELSAVHDLVNAAVIGVRSYIEINSVFATAILGVALKPFSEPSIANLVPALGAGIMLWRKKSWIFSSLFHTFQSK